MLSKEERNYIYQSSYLKQKEMENQYEVVTSFYPAQRLTHELSPRDIVEIMNCCFYDADELMSKLCRKRGKKGWSALRVFDFCDYWDIDEMMVQVFLASLRETGPLPPVKKRKPAPQTPGEATDGPPRKINDIKADLQKGIMENFETIKMRAAKWRMENPLGVPMYKVADLRFRVVIRPYEVAHILEIHIQTARQMFIEARTAHNVPKQSFLSLKLFCNAHHIDEEDTRRSLSIFHDDEKIYGDKE